MASSPPVPPGINLGESQQPQLYAASITTYCLAVLAVAMRFWCRRLMKAGYRWDDWLVAAATVVATGLLASTIIWIKQGFGKHYEVLGPDFVTNFFTNLFAGEILYTVIICLVKYSILALYWRLFGSSAISSSVRIPVYVLGAITTAWGIAVVLVTIFQCNPVSGFWNRKMPAKCIVDDYAFFVGIAVPNIITDVALLILPLPYIWRLHRSKSQKIALIGIFMLGSFVCIISIVRLVTLVNEDLVSPDMDWNFAQVGVWTVTESNIAIVSACLPTLRPILSLILTGSPIPSQYGNYWAKRSGSSRQWNDSQRPKPVSRSHDVITSDNESQHGFMPLPDDVPSQDERSKAVQNNVYVRGINDEERAQNKRAKQGKYLNAGWPGKRMDKPVPDIELQHTGSGISVKNDATVEWTATQRK